MSSRSCRYSGLSTFRNWTLAQTMNICPIFSLSVILWSVAEAQRSPWRSRWTGGAATAQGTASMATSVIVPNRNLVAFSFNSNSLFKRGRTARNRSIEQIFLAHGFELLQSVLPILGNAARIFTRHQRFERVLVAHQAVERGNLVIVGIKMLQSGRDFQSQLRRI